MKNKRPSAATGKAAPAASAKALLAALDRLPVAFALFDAGRRLAAWNAPLAALGLFPKSLLKEGKPLADFMRRDAGLKRRAAGPHEIKLPDGRVLRAARERVPPGQLLVTYEDVTAARLAAQRYDTALRAVNEGVYDWDIATGTIYYSEGVHRATGMTSRDIRTPRDWRDRFHPDDLPGYDAALIAHFKGRTERFECDYRFRGKDGSWRWARQHGIAIRDAGGRAVRMVGSTGDITALKRVEQALAESQERYALATQAATEGIYEWNLETGWLYLSDRAREFFAVKGDALTPATWNKRVHADDFEGYRKAIRAYFDGRKLAFEHEYRILDAGGGWSWVSDRAVAVRNDAGRVLRLVGALADITQRKLREEDLHRARDEATEALEQQTATAEILRVISGSPTNVQPVFDSIATSALRLFGGLYVSVVLVRGDRIELASAGGDPDVVAKVMSAFPIPLNRESVTGCTVVDREVQNMPDMEAPELPDFARALSRGAGVRALLGAPMLREGAAIGAIMLFRDVAGEFSAKQVSLLKTFADQAVIAIENVRLFNETKESLEQQTAISEILRVISNSPSDVQPVLEAVAERAARICGAQVADIVLAEGDTLRIVASIGDITRPGITERTPLDRTTVMGRSIVDRATVHVADLQNAPENEYPRGRTLAIKHGHRTILAVPLLREDRVLGTILLRRAEVRAFDDKHIGLLKTFANQAAIAIENVRLFNETKEALERQTATGEILKVIASSPSDVQPVFDAIVASAVSLFGRRAIVRTLTEDGQLLLRAHHSVSTGDAAGAVASLPLDRDSTGGRAVLERKALQVADLESPDAPPFALARADNLGYRSIAAAPLIREDKAIGVIAVTATKPGELSDKQLSLLQTFADQAVIAIENVRLFNETKEALERQTATAEILKVIAGSPTDVQPVFDAIARSANRLIGGFSTAVARVFDDTLHLVGYTTTGEAGDTALKNAFPMPVTSFDAVTKTIRSGVPVRVVDTEIAPEVSSGLRDLARARGFRSMLYVPLIREGVAIGMISVTRREPGEFSGHQVELLQTFADQAVIAIENVRLFNETREALERQTATAEILKVIASSPSDVQPVFDAIVETAKRLIGAFSATVTRVGDGKLHLVAHTATTPEGAEALNRFFPIPVESTAMGRAIQLRQPTFIDDFEADSDDARDGRDLARLRGFRSVAFVPLMRGDVAIGSLNVTRRETGRMSDRHVDLLKTFGDQAVIAIENVRLFNETKEALERQTATAEILKVIASSPSDVQPVFDTVAKRSVDLCGGSFGVVTRYDGALIHIVSIQGTATAEAAAKIRAAFPAPPSRRGAASRSILTRDVVHMPDVTQDPEYEVGGVAHIGGIQSILTVPLLRDGQPLGSVSVARTQRASFSPHQIALLRTFADQAVIAIENVRLFNETKEALERQTATAEILRVISSSPTDTQPVFEAIVQSGLKLFPNAAVVVTLPDGDRIRLAAMADADPLHAAQWKKRHDFPLTREYMHAVAILDRMVIDVPDAQAYEGGPLEAGIRNFLATGNRAITIMPMLRADAVIGTISVIRLAPGPLTEKQLALLQTFADQAVIAIENVRLFNETKEALERQTATAEILKVISESPTDVQPVFDTILENATHLCEANLALLGLYDGEIYHTLAHRGGNPDFIDFVKRRGPFTPPAGGALGRMIAERQPIQIEDFRALPLYQEGDPNVVATVDVGGARTYLAVPMLKEGRVVGGIAIYRSEVRPFTQKQIDLVSTFASQGVIAIENVRLFNETREALERLTATSEVLKVISSSPTDVQPVFDSIAERAAVLCGARFCSLSSFDGETIHMAAVYGATLEGAAAIRAAYPMKPGSSTLAARVIRDRKPLHIADVQADPDYEGKEAATAVGFRSVLGVPMMREGHLAGAIVIGREQAGLFPDNQVNLLTTFADQAVIAIENVRLFHEIEEKGRQLEVASQHKSNFLASMSHELRTPLNAILGFNEMILGQVYGEVPKDMQEPLVDIQTSGKHLLRLINNVLDLAKIEAGRMELSLSDYSVHDTVASVHSTLRPLAAEKGLEFLASVPNDVPLAYGDGGRMAQCLMNLAGNSLKFTRAGKVEIAVESKGELLVYKVTDTGIGIAPDKIGSLFTEFKQTDATIASEYGGTGLGLSISRKFVEMHGGRIWVESELGRGSAFIIEVPIRMKTT